MKLKHLKTKVCLTTYLVTMTIFQSMKITKNTIKEVIIYNWLRKVK